MESSTTLQERWMNKDSWFKTLGSSIFIFAMGKNAKVVSAPTNKLHPHFNVFWMQPRVVYDGIEGYDSVDANPGFDGLASNIGVGGYPGLPGYEGYYPAVERKNGFTFVHTVEGPDQEIEEEKITLTERIDDTQAPTTTFPTYQPTQHGDPNLDASHPAKALGPINPNAVQSSPLNPGFPSSPLYLSSIYSPAYPSTPAYEFSPSNPDFPSSPTYPSLIYSSVIEALEIVED
jgi:hypothetical protein